MNQNFDLFFKSLLVLLDLLTTKFLNFLHILIYKFQLMHIRYYFNFQKAIYILPFSLTSDTPTC